MGDNMLMLLWLVALIVFAGAEAATPTALVSIWFALGALGALITSAITHSFWIQLVVFLLVSCLCFALLRPLVRRYVTPRTERTNADRLLGQEAEVTEAIDNVSGTGQVRVGGQVWTARTESEHGAPLMPGARVTVLRIEGVKLIVQPMKTKEEIHHEST